MSEGPYRNIAVPDEHSMTEEEKQTWLEKELSDAIDRANDAKATVQDRIAWAVKIAIFQGALMKLQLDSIEAKLARLIESNSKS